tara:strand:- start:1963 stop:2382 length:420 start_codon:yes stop_codon:yes gene_type:complete
MKATASKFSLLTESNWSGTSFKVVDSNNAVLFESNTRGPAFSVINYLQNGISYVDYRNNKLRISQNAFLMFNSLITKYKLGRPKNKAELGVARIPLKSGLLDLEAGLYIPSDHRKLPTPIYKNATLDELFSSIQQGTYQ